MKRTLLIMALPISVLMMSCGGGEETEETTEGEADSSTTEVIEEEEATELAFNGVEKDGYMLYGHSEIDASELATTDEMFQEFESTGSFNRKVQVNINSVCQKAGCWITFKDQEENDVYVYFRDHFTIPIETAEGTEAILYGNLYMDTVTVDFQKHLMEDNLSEGEELDQDAVAALEEKYEFAFDCESVLVKQ